MKIPRCTRPEIHDRPWCCRAVHDGVTDFLAFFAEFSGLRRKAYGRIAQFLENGGGNKVVELCAGSGFGAMHMLRRLRQLLPGRDVSVVATDIKENSNWPLIRSLTEGGVSAYKKDAETALREEDGLFVMFAALHHFSPAEIVSLLKTAMECGRAFICVDYFTRGRLVDLFPLFSGPVLMFFAAPLIFPFSWVRLILTWVFPVLPVVLFVDTLLSMLRSYTPDELKEIVASAGLQCGKDAEVFGFVEAGGAIRMPAIILGTEVAGCNSRFDQKESDRVKSIINADEISAA